MNAVGFQQPPGSFTLYLHQQWRRGALISETCRIVELNPSSAAVRYEIRAIGHLAYQHDSDRGVSQGDMNRYL